MQSNFELVEQEETFVLIKAGIISVAISVFIAGTAVFYMHHNFHPVPIESTAPYLDAELVQAEPTPRLYEKKTAAAPVATKHEETISKDLSKGKASSSPLAKTMESENQTRSEAAPVVLTHGPVVSYSPSPQLPSYLKDQNLKTTVLIEFVITALGSARPSLIGSSGNEELDALALTTARSWILSLHLRMETDRCESSITHQF